jgi:hypothetical protein
VAACDDAGRGLSDAMRFDSIRYDRARGRARTQHPIAPPCHAVVVAGIRCHRQALAVVVVDNCRLVISGVSQGRLKSSRIALALHALQSSSLMASFGGGQI